MPITDPFEQPEPVEPTPTKPTPTSPWTGNESEYDALKSAIDKMFLVPKLHLGMHTSIII